MSDIKRPEELAEDVVEEFSVFDEWLDKYEYLIELGKSLPIIEEKEKTDDKLISECQSRVWLACEYRDGRVWFTADSDAIITKGIISLLIRVYNGQKPEDIVNSDFGFIEKIGLRENLSPTRANGLVSMIAKIKEYAASYDKPAAKAPLKEDVVLALKTVFDPEIPVDIYELGLIYEINIDGSDIAIKMTLTAPNCPIADDVVAQVYEAVRSVPNAGNVKVDLVFEPEWTPSLMSDEAKLALNMFD